MNRRDYKSTNKVSKFELGLPSIILGGALVASAGVYATMDSSNNIKEYNQANIENTTNSSYSLENRINTNSNTINFSNLNSSNITSCNIPTDYNIVNKEVSFSNGLNSNITYGVKDDKISDNVCVEMPIDDFKAMCYDHLLNYDSKDCGRILADLSNDNQEKQAYQRLVDRIN